MLLVCAVVYFWPANNGNANAAFARAVTVETALSRQDQVALVYEGVGTALALESIEVTAKESGIVTEIHFESGQPVAEDDLLVSLDTRELRAELEVEKAQYDQAQLEAKRAERLLKSRSISRDEYDALQAELRAASARRLAAKARLEEAVIRAPFSGVVGLKEISPGALIEPGTRITTLDDISYIKLFFSVPEVYLAKLQPGLPVNTRTAAYPDKQFVGKIAAIDSRVDAGTRSVRVVGYVPNTEGLLKPGLFINISLPLDVKQNAVLIPEEALLAQGRKQFVYLVEEQKAKLQEVQIGQRNGGEVEILAGLDAGVPVVTAGLQKLRDGVPVELPNAVATEHTEQ